MNEDVLEEVVATVINYIYGGAIIGVLAWILVSIA